MRRLRPVPHAGAKVSLEDFLTGTSQVAAEADAHARTARASTEHTLADRP